MLESGNKPESSNDPLVDPRNSLNSLTAKEWISESVSVWTQRGLGAKHADAAIEKLHPAPFSYTDVGRLVRMFTKPGHTVLDPFSGVGSTLKACAVDGRNGIGFELYQDFVELTKVRLSQELPEPVDQNITQIIRQGDAADLALQLEPESIDFIVTSPPYWSILNKKSDHKVKQVREAGGYVTNYGDDSRDLGNIVDYDEFIDRLSDILRVAAVALKPKGYMALVVGDFRHGSKYYMFHADIARSMEQRGFVLQAVNVLYQRHKRVFPYGYPYAYVPNVHHQNIVILRKQ